MPRIRLTNEADETLEVEPGETIDIFGEKWRRRVMSSRQNGFEVDEIGEP